MIMKSKSNPDYYYYIARVNIKKYRKLANMTTQELADKSEVRLVTLQDMYK